MKQLSTISFRVGNQINLDATLAVYRDCSLGARRPVDDRERMRAMLRNANLVVSAWDGPEMIGIARGMSDFQYVTYLADLAVRNEYQRIGVGKELIRHMQACARNATIVLLAAPDAESYYPHIGFKHHPQAWVLEAPSKKTPHEDRETGSQESCG